MLTQTKLSKTAFIVPYSFIPPKNGGHHAAFGFCDFLSKELDLICISTLNNNNSKEFRLEKIFSDETTKYINPIVLYKIAQFLKNNQIRQCIMHQPFIALFLLPFKRFLNIRFLIYVQNIEYQRFKSLKKLWWPLLYAIEWFTYKYADGLFFISPDDQTEAIALFRLNPETCCVVNYGSYLTATPANKPQIREQMVDALHIQPQCKIMLFFGPQSYAPNLEAVRLIRDQLYPQLIDKAPFPFEIFICGGGLPADERDAFKACAHAHYLGFVDDIDNYVAAADIMLNPILTGGGVKTKIIESIAAGTPVVSFQTGAAGMDFNVTGDQLITVADRDIDAFVDGVIAIGQRGYTPTPTAFYDAYYWGNAIQPALALLEDDA